MSADERLLSPVEFWTKRGWRYEGCGCCSGLEWGGEYPRECRTCLGNGMIWVTPKGRLALYPGGPFRGVA